MMISGNISTFQINHQHECTLRLPMLQPWFYAINIHGGLTFLIGIPLAWILYVLAMKQNQNRKKNYNNMNDSSSSSSSTTSDKSKNKNEKKNNIETRKRNKLIVSLCIGLFGGGVVPVTIFYLRSRQYHDTTWFGCFLASVFGFSTFFKSVAVGINQFPIPSMMGKTTTTKSKTTTTKTTTSTSTSTSTSSAGNEHVSDNENDEIIMMDMKTFIHWFVALPEPIFAKGKLKIATKHDYYKILYQFIVYKIFGMFILLSIIHYRDNEYLLRDVSTSSSVSTSSTSSLSIVPPRIPSENKARYGFTTTTSEDGNDNNVYYHFYYELMQVLIDGYIHVWVLYLFLSFCLDFSSIGNMILSGKCHHVGFDQPLWSSRTLREAWGTRWNITVHTLLKRTVYVPIRTVLGMSRPISALLTFLVSGLLHEYTFLLHNHTSYEPILPLLFFLLMGILMLIEEMIFSKYGATNNNGDSSSNNTTTTTSTTTTSTTTKILSKIPSPIISSVIVLCIAIPFERLFIKGWLISGFIESASELLPHYNCIPIPTVP